MDRGVGLNGHYPRTVRLDPLGTLRHKPRQGQVQNRDSLAQTAPGADRDDLLIIREVDSIDRDAHTEDLGFEWHGEMFFEHAEEACSLLLVAERIDDGFLDERSDA